MNPRSQVVATGGLRSRVPLDSLPRERLWRHGPATLTDAELLAVVLGTGLPGQDVLSLAQTLLAAFGGLRGLLGAEPTAMIGTAGIGRARAAQLGAVMELARRSLAEDLTREHTLDDPARMQAYCALLLGHQTVEVCYALFLDNRLRLIASEVVSRGTLAQATVYPREVVRAALRHHAAMVVLAHNHPSGVAEPSAADRQLTRHLAQALALVDIRLVDHVLVAGGHTVSFAQHGLMT